MTKLEPTRTSSDLTATERLRELLDERGVEWAEYGDGYTLLRHGGREYTVQPNVCNRLIVTNLTPAQAIAATLGSCNCSNDCANGERMDVPRLPHFWTHDGALHVELPKLPESISVRLSDQRDREVGSARVWQYTRDSGTCQKVYLVETSDDLIESWHPIGVYLSSKAAGDCAEALRGEVDGIRQFARVVELKVVDE